MVTFANLGSVRLPSLKFVGLRVRRYGAISVSAVYLQQFPSYSNRKCKKIAVFTYRSPHFCFLWRRPCDFHAICCIDGKTIQCLPNPSQHVPIYIQQFPSYTMLKSMHNPKISIFTTFLFPLGTPLGQSR